MGITVCVACGREDDNTWRLLREIASAVVLRAAGMCTADELTNGKRMRSYTSVARAVQVLLEVWSTTPGLSFDPSESRTVDKAGKKVWHIIKGR